VANERLRLLIPALIAGEEDMAALRRTLAGLPAGLLAVVQPVMQLAAGIPARLHTLIPAKSWRLEPIVLAEPAGKWGALRDGLARGETTSDWVAVCDADDTYDLSVLPTLLARALAGEASLYQGERVQIVIDDTELGYTRAQFELVVNELLRQRTARWGLVLSSGVHDLQSGFFLVRRQLLERFFALPAMDAFDKPAAVGDSDSALELPWSSYGGELHLHLFAATVGVGVAGHPVTARCGRVSGLTVAAIGEMLRQSRYFQDVTPREYEAAIAAVSAATGWTAAEQDLMRTATAEAFPVC